MQEDRIRPLVCEIPIETSGDGISTIISLDGADVDHDIYIFLEHSFKKLRRDHSDFPLPTKDQLAQLASRAGRRFIVASTMVKFIDDGYNDPCHRLQLMLDLTSELLPGTEVYKLYDHILSDPKRAYLHLSVVATLVDPLPISQLLKLLGPGEGRDVERTLVQLRSFIDIPTDSSLPLNISHSSVRDYISDPSNCSLHQVQNITPPHTLLACSSFRLMTKCIPDSMALIDTLSKLNRQKDAMLHHDPQKLKRSLTFVQTLEPLRVLAALLCIRGDLYFPWLETVDGRAWLCQEGKDWLQKSAGQDWLQMREGDKWLQSQAGKDWLETVGGRGWLETRSGESWLQTDGGLYWLQAYGREWLHAQDKQQRRQTESRREWVRIWDQRERTPEGSGWLNAQSTQDIL
ncbi:hypothetical protein K503DRAFT_805108 [Rhizopogon vinicolor AM-OR11-026]|uniref:Uncharacterized protein n=1 Tax=Rhizopogon vinicolor AM-OR11-026 TaxID=1314800 RepID=A0A1B7MIZ8_9AGAM|nr:hypothetical protein K503DRAFT_805108 [Rhizopogon vinicolor AM-OR11-026]